MIRETTFPLRPLPLRRICNKKMKKGEMLSSTMLVILILIVIGVVVLFVSLYKGSSPLVDFFRNMVDFGANKSKIDYNPENEFIVYDEFGSLYPVIRVTYTGGCDDEFLFRWDRNLKKVETAILLEAIPSIVCVTEFSNGWLTNPYTMSAFKGKKIEDDVERKQIIYVMEAKSEDEMIKRISQISANEKVKVDFPFVRPDYDCQDSDNFDGGKFCYLKPDSKFPRVESAEGVRGKHDKISASEIRQILLGLPEYYVFHNEDILTEQNPLNRTIAYADIFSYYIIDLFNAKKDKCPAYGEIYLIAESQSSNPSLAGNWMINFKYDWTEHPLVKYEKSENVITIRREDSFYIDFLCAAGSEALDFKLDYYDNKLKNYLNLKRKLRNGEVYP